MLKPKQMYANGTRVEAKAKGWKSHYWGEVQSFDKRTGMYTIRFEDGEVRKDVKGFSIRGPKIAQSFTAPDGKTFTDKAEYRKYLAENFFSFRDKTGETLRKASGDIGGQSFNISNLKDCEVMLMDHSDQVLIDGLENCKVLIGPSSESVFVRNAKNCTLYIACKQFRSRDCSNCTISLYTKTEPIVETSSKMRFFPYMCSYPGQTDHFKKANLIPERNHWCNVFDFNAGDSSIPMPHWSLVEEKEGWPEWHIKSDLGNPENPVPKDSRAVPVEREQAFGFGLTQEQAEQAFSAQESGAQPALAATLAPPPTPAAVVTTAPAKTLTNNAPISVTSPTSPSRSTSVPPPAPVASSSPSAKVETSPSTAIPMGSTDTYAVIVGAGIGSPLALNVIQECLHQGMQVLLGAKDINLLKETKAKIEVAFKGEGQVATLPLSNEVTVGGESGSVCDLVKNTFPGCEIGMYVVLPMHG